MIKTRPRRRFDAAALALDAPLPLLVTCTGMALPWPSGSPADTQDVRPVALRASCGGCVDACQCAAPGTPPPGWEPDTEDAADLFASEAYDAWPTLAERLAVSIHDDRA